MRKPTFYAYVKTKAQIRCTVTTQLISTFVIKIVKSLYFINQKFQASSHLLWLYSLVCVCPGRKPQRQVLSELTQLSVPCCCFEVMAKSNEFRHKKICLPSFEPQAVQLQRKAGCFYPLCEKISLLCIP